MCRRAKYVASTLILLLTLLMSGGLPVAAQAEPDLEPVQLIVTSAYAGTANAVTVVVANNEDVAVADFDVRLEANGMEVATISGNSIMGSGDPYYWPVSVPFEWTPAEAADYTLTATVDSAAVVMETDEGNNQLTQATAVLAADPVTVKVRVEGAAATIWSGSVTFFTSVITDKEGTIHSIDHPTALGALNAAAEAGGFGYVVSSAWGPLTFVEAVAGEANQGMDGWLYRVNWLSPSVGARDYGLADGDEVLWYYGAWTAAPLRLTVDQTSVESPGTFTATVMVLDDVTSNWSALEGATLYAGSRSYTTDADGEVKDISLDPGGYSVYATKGDYTQYIRSNEAMVVVYLSLVLEPGWNFISVPKKLAAGYATAAELFSGVDTAGHSIFQYDATSGWSALSDGDEIRPLHGIWIYSASLTELHPVFDTNPRQVPPTVALAAGWNAIGFSDFSAASANSALTSVESSWAVLMGFDAATQTYQVSIINNAGAEDAHSESREMACWKGYWLYMTGAAELAAISS